MDSSRVAAIRFFSDVPETEVAAIAEVAFEIKMAPGETLAKAGGPGYALFAIEAGTADVVVAGTKVRSVGSGDVVGEIAVLASPPDPLTPPELAEGGPRTASVVATSSMRVIAVYKRDIWALERHAPVVVQRLRARLDEHRAADEQRELDA
ncbi:MAG TPA: cyclic nucleotide-binding domain-containing protein [Solirubrobacteraceae bacterium]|nr:cyclic nucleotide-binding domain-containing protein [Solirubrobacteraceae bacterium]